MIFDVTPTLKVVRSSVPGPLKKLGLDIAPKVAYRVSPTLRTSHLKKYYPSTSNYRTHAGSKSITLTRLCRDLQFPCACRPSTDILTNYLLQALSPL